MEGMGRFVFSSLLVLLMFGCDSAETTNKSENPPVPWYESVYGEYRLTVLEDVPITGDPILWYEEPGGSFVSGQPYEAWNIYVKDATLIIRASEFEERWNFLRMQTLNGVETGFGGDDSDSYTESFSLPIDQMPEGVIKSGVHDSFDYHVQPDGSLIQSRSGGRTWVKK